MAKLGDARTSRFLISAPEVRVGPLDQANKLKQEHSIGLLNSATVSFAVESVDLEGGLPRVLYDTAVTSQPGSVAVEMREYSRRNLQMLLGYTPSATASMDVKSNVAADATAGAVTIDVTASDGANFSAGQLVGIYQDGPTNTANISYCKIESIATDTLTFIAETPLLFDYAIGDHLFNAQPLALGAIDQTNYFTLQVLGTRRDGTPSGFLFWKCALSAGLEMAYSADDFGTNPGEFKVLNPSAAEYGTGGPLEHVAELIADFPLGIYLGGGDV